MANFYNITTNIGNAFIANATLLNQEAGLVYMAVGDGNGSPTTPSPTQIALVNEVYRAQINQLTRDPNNPNYIIAELIVPTNVGGWTVREVGVYDENGNLFAVGNFPETYKPQLSEGSGRDLLIRVVMQVSNASIVTLKVDPTIIMASQQWVTDNFSVFPATETQAGIARIATAAEVADGVNDNTIITPAKLASAIDAILPAGGTTGQALIKASDDDKDVEWGDVGGNTVFLTLNDGNNIVGYQTYSAPNPFPGYAINIVLEIYKSDDGWCDLPVGPYTFYSGSNYSYGYCGTHKEVSDVVSVSIFGSGLYHSDQMVLGTSHIYSAPGRLRITRQGKQS